MRIGAVKLGSVHHIDAAVQSMSDQPSAFTRIEISLQWSQRQGAKDKRGDAQTSASQFRLFHAMLPFFIYYTFCRKSAYRIIAIPTQ